MSDLRIALVAEGPTDAIIIGAALQALLPRPFVLTLLQPEPTTPSVGTGWGGVLRWCQAFVDGGHGQLEADPTLPGFDLFVLHADADVADQSYANVSEDVVSVANALGWHALPDQQPCPPPSASADVVRRCLLSWTSLQVPGNRTVLCVPSKAIDAWLAAAVLPAEHTLVTGLECNGALEARLATLPLQDRIKKTGRTYRLLASTVTANWPQVRSRCSQAERFSTEVIAALPITEPPSHAP